jgi:AraC-like DNA-binding protein
MKVLADRIGHSHVNHFIGDFKKKYGVTPGSVKKNRLGSNKI